MGWSQLDGDQASSCYVTAVAARYMSTAAAGRGERMGDEACTTEPVRDPVLYGYVSVEADSSYSPPPALPSHTDF